MKKCNEEHHLCHQNAVDNIVWKQVSLLALRHSIASFLLFVGVSALAFGPEPTLADQNPLAEEKETTEEALQRPTSFLPTWKLLSPGQKQAFLSGYLHSLKDSGQITDLAIEHIRKNPEQAISSLEQVRHLYDTRHVQPESLVSLVDDFYSDPQNRDAPLSRAVTSSSMRLR